MALVGGVTLFVGGTYLALWRAGAERPVIRPIVIGALILMSPLLASIAAWQALLFVAILVVGIAVAEQRSVAA